MRARAWRVALMGGLLPTAAAPAAAQPDMSRPAPETVADRGSAFYRFEDVRLASPDGARRYRLRIGIPKRPPPPGGYPVAWLLDGKAALAHVDDALLGALDRAAPPVIVAIGHDTPLRLDAAERIRDYTPGPGSADPRGRRGGGADALLDLIAGEMSARVAALAPLDGTRQTIWGHSLGGLFVLHALLARPDLFSRYYAASPSLWWNGGEIRTRLNAVAGTAAPCSCTVVVGEGTGNDSDRRSATARSIARAAPGPEEAAAFRADLARLPRVTVRWVGYEGLGHGATLGASLPPALRLAAGMEE